MITTTAGKAALNALLPAPYQNFNITWDKGAIQDLLSKLAVEYPNKYPQIADGLLELGKIGIGFSGSFPFSLSDLLPSKYRDQYFQEVESAVIRRLNSGPMYIQDEKLGQELAAINERYMDKIKKEFKSEDNPVYKLIAGQIRGNITALKRMKFAEGSNVDAWERLIPYPIFRNFSEGLSPAEYWSAGYGSKKGIVLTKLSPGAAGEFYKYLMQATHRLVVVDNDGPEVGDMRGMVVDAGDIDNIGAFLAAPVGDYKTGTLITPEVFEKIKNKGKILVRSPIAGGPQSGVYAKAVGMRGGKLPEKGIIVGLEASQAVGERVSQMSVGKKHIGAIAKGSGELTKIVKQLISVPKNYPGAVHAEADGRVTDIQKAPAGGHYVVVEGVSHYVPQGIDILVKKGDVVEAGDILSEGLPNPRKVVEKKGIGEGRRYFGETFTNVLRELGIPIHRRNSELIARGLIDLVEVTRPYKDLLPGDIIQYNFLEHNWEERPDTVTLPPGSAKGYYLERPVLHYTIGTRITPSVIENLKKFGITKIRVNKEPLPFRPIMIRAAEVLSYDPEFLVRFLGAYQKRNIQEAAALGGVTEKYRTTSFVPSLAEGVYFGEKWPEQIIRAK